MRKVGIVIDSTFGLESQIVKSQNVSVIPLNVYVDNKEYVDGSFEPELVIDALQRKLNVKTSQPSPDLFLQAYKEQLETYEEVICLTISKTLSGTYNSAILAKDILNDERVAVIDSETTINGGAYLVEKLLEFLTSGKTLSQALVYLEQLKSQGSLLFTVDNLQTLVRNGRIGKVQAVIGNILKVKPILRFRKGVLELEHKVRSFGNVLIYIVKEAEKLLSFGKVIVRIAYVDQLEQAKQLEHDIYQLGDQVEVKITGHISAVVSAHVGLGGLGVYLAHE